MQSKLIIPTRNYKNVKKQQDYCSVGYAIRQNKGRLILSKAPFNHSKTMLLRLKIHVFCLVIHPDKQTNVNHSAFSRHIINIRYLLIFQIEKIFCPKFLLKARTAD